MAPSAEAWARVQELFAAAVDLQPAERAILLDRACARDENIRREVESLIEADERVAHLIDNPASGLVRDLLLREEQEFAGRHFGAYRAIRELGRGGLGAVYLAARADDQYQKEVAIKVVKRGLDTDDILRRFRAERQILAQLEHPNIARLIDAGSTEDGLPYFVMEYVDGEPISRYCDAQNLSTRDRLELFRLVCSAVTYAHQHLVIHRDIKPSNILVTRQGIPKLLDFGIAKVLHADDPLAAVTITGMRVMTPEYASPEQVRGAAITTATDIYSLGVLLYELLTNQKPYRLTSRSAEEFSRLIAEQIPQRPSTALARCENDVRSALRNPRSLRGDLDTIIMMALRKEPERRYTSVAQFSEDIRCHLDRLPVIARKDTLAYRSGKFVTRHKAGVAAAVLVLLSLFAGIVLSLNQARRANAHARIAEEQRDAAQRASARAEKTSRFMQSFLANANPNWYGRGGGRTDVTVRQAIDDAAARLDTDLADQPEVRGDLHHTIGEIYRVAGEDHAALHHFRRSLHAYREGYGEAHPKVAMALFYFSIAAGREGAWPQEARALRREAAAMMRATDPDNINLPHILQTVAGDTMSAGEETKDAIRLSEAESLIADAKKLFVRHYGENHLATYTVDGNLARLARLRGDFAEAERLQEQALRRFCQVDEGGPAHIRGLFGLAEIKLAAGKAAEAESLFAQTMDVARHHWGSDDPRFERLTKEIAAARSSAALE